MVSFHIRLLDRAGNNLVNADFSPYSRMFFAVKYIYLTLYIVYMCRIAPIYSVPLYLLALLAVPAARCACLPAPVRARACGRARCARCGRRTSGRLPAPARVCGRARVRLPIPGQRWTF